MLSCSSTKQRRSVAKLKKKKTSLGTQPLVQVLFWVRSNFVRGGSITSHFHKNLNWNLPEEGQLWVRTETENRILNGFGFDSGILP